MYKVPKTTTTRGTEFFYIGNDSRNFTYKDTNIRTRETRNPLYMTLQPIYENVNFLFCLFNFFRPTREFFTHFETSQLLVKCCNF